MASCMSLSADGEKAHPKVVLQGFFESSARTEARLFRKKIVYTVESDGYIFHKIFMILV